MTFILYGYLKSGVGSIYEDNIKSPERKYCLMIEDTSINKYQTFCLLSIMGQSPNEFHNLHNCGWCNKHFSYRLYETTELKRYKTLEEIEADYDYLLEVVNKHVVLSELIQ